MDQYFQKLHKALNSGNPEIKTWFLIRHNYLPFILVGSYIIFSCYLGPAFMKNRKPFELRIPMVIFNCAIVVSYVIAIFIFFKNIVELPFEKFCKGTTLRKGTIEYTIISSFWMLYLLKYVELFDTVFFILRKKQHLITFLHVMHHALVPIIIWIAFRTEKSGMQSIPIILNSIVHIIMYTYYGLAAMGPQVRRYLWWKKYLTQLQMIQFLLITVFVLIVVPLSGCSIVISSYLVNIFIPPLFLYLFYQYYKASFHQEKKVKNGMAKMEKSPNGRMERGTTVYKASEKKE